MLPEQGETNSFTTTHAKPEILVNINTNKNYIRRVQTQNSHADLDISDFWSSVQVVALND